MKIDFKHLIKQSWGLLSNTGKSWDAIGAEKAASRDIRGTYVFPWIIVCTVIVFLSGLLYVHERKFEIAFLKSIVAAVSLSGGYFVAIRTCFWFLKKRNITNCSKDDCERLAAYSFTTLFVLKALVALLPSLFFLQIFVVHCAYLVWEGLRAVMNLNEDERGNVVLVLSLIIILSPAIIAWILNFMVPNA
jgi:hypothetical protein